MDEMNELLGFMTFGNELDMWYAAYRLAKAGHIFPCGHAHSIPDIVNMVRIAYGNVAADAYQEMIDMSEMKAMAELN